MNCPFCDSEKSTKHLIRKNKSGEKEVFKCKGCKKFFVENSNFKRMRFQPKIIIFALEMFCKGFSFGIISFKIEEKFKQKISRSTIYRWVEKYVHMKF